MRWRTIVDVLSGVLLGLCGVAWIGAVLAWLDFPGVRKGFGGPITLEDAGYLAVATGLAAAGAWLLSWLGKRMEG